MTPQDFITAISEAARASAIMSGIPASFTVAEGALESGWGTSQLAIQAMNLFGVKADSSWSGEVVIMNTREYLQHQWVMVPARWRKYADWQGCMDDHAKFLLTNKRYTEAFTHKDGPGFATAVAAAGYATDPSYSDKLISIMTHHNLAVLDEVT
jgi:flagellum-specific peptidoglycan hydrolase FlgJ